MIPLPLWTLWIVCGVAGAFVVLAIVVRAVERRHRRKWAKRRDAHGGYIVDAGRVRDAYRLRGGS